MTRPPSALRDELHSVFGPAAFGDGLFYSHAPAIRFELSRHGAHVDLFAQAFDRGREILTAIFPPDSPLVAVVVMYEEPSRAVLRTALKSLRRLGVRPVRPRTVWREDGAEGEPEDARTFVAFACGAEAVPRLLWGAAAVDLGVYPRLPGRVYLCDPARGVLAHPYDDRGMDVVGPNHALLAETYRRFPSYLLDYDRERMAGFFGAPS